MFSNQNLRQFAQEIPKLLSDKQTNRDYNFIYIIYRYASILEQFYLFINRFRSRSWNENPWDSTIHRSPVETDLSWLKVMKTDLEETNIKGVEGDT